MKNDLKNIIDKYKSIGFLDVGPNVEIPYMFKIQNLMLLCITSD